MISWKPASMAVMVTPKRDVVHSTELRLLRADGDHVVAVLHQEKERLRLRQITVGEICLDDLAVLRIRSSDRDVILA